MLSRYIALVLSGERKLPEDHGFIAQRDGDDERSYYYYSPHTSPLMDLTSFLESTAQGVGCTPTAPSIFNLQRFLQYWLYPAWPVWFRQQGPRANPEALETVMNSLSFFENFDLDPPNILGFPVAIAMIFFSTLIRCIPFVNTLYSQAGLGAGWPMFRPRKHVLHGNDLPPVNPFLQFFVLAALGYIVYKAAGGENSIDLWPSVQQLENGVKGVWSMVNPRECSPRDQVARDAT